MRYDPKAVAFGTKYKTVGGIAQARGSFSDYIEHWLNVRRRAGDDTQNLARRRLLFQRLAEFSRLRGDRFLLRGDRFLLRGNPLLLRSYRFLQLRKGFHVRCGARHF